MYNYRFKGSKSHLNLPMKEIAKLAREYAKSEPKLRGTKWSVRCSKSTWTPKIEIALIEAPWEAFTDVSEKHLRWNEYSGNAEGVTEYANEAMRLMRDFVEDFNYDRSDPQTDYFDVGFCSDYQIGDWNKPFKKVEKKSRRIRTPTEPISEGVHIVAYTDKSFVVCGDTKPIKELLKYLGGRFNPRLDLNCRVGWVFPIAKMEMVREFFEL